MALQGLSPQTTRATEVPGTSSRQKARTRRDGRGCACPGQDAPLGVGGIGGEEEPGAGGAEDADAAQTAVERVDAAALGEMADGDDGGPAALSRGS